MFIQTRGPLIACLLNDYVLKNCLLRIWGPPGARGPGARAPMAPLLIRHWPYMFANCNIHSMDEMRRTRIYSFIQRLKCSSNAIITCMMSSTFIQKCAIWNHWFKCLYLYNYIVFFATSMYVLNSVIMEHPIFGFTFELLYIIHLTFMDMA